MAVNIPSPAPRALVLVVDPKAGLRVREGNVISIEEGVDVVPLRDLLNEEQAAIRPLYGVSEEWLKHRTSSTKALMGVGQRLDLSIFYKVTCPDDKLKSLADRLRKLSIVQSAYIKPDADLPFIDTGDEPAAGPPLGVVTDDFTKHQRYLNAAPEGIDARYAWTKEGGGGRGVKIIDIEGAWRFSHEDLLANPGGCVGGIPISKRKWRKHGTAVLGILSGDHNDLGIAGICPDADVNTISIFNNSDGNPSPDWGIAAAIRLAADMLCPGDIILIEDHRPGPAVNFQENENTQDGYIPVEWWPCNMAAILYANSRDIIVVEAGGNGRQDLDDQIYCQNPPAPHGPFPHWWRNPFKRNPIDTGAILVGAGLPPHDPPDSGFAPDRSRWELSNHGAVIDTQGWGEEVATSGGNGDLTPRGTEEDRQYTSRFNGTSSAAAMVAGALGCLQGVLRASGGALNPASARALLQDDVLGSPQQDGPLGPANLETIGPRPDLRKLINHLIPPFSFKRMVGALIKALLGQRLK
ncbi:MAG TPA: S8 family serine peptidase [Pyrinomonadaceae bacterium]|nr:S8 family serine peptidase [Pyrinomonadaceae bacterium]